jgi:hypothetical protein
MSAATQVVGFFLSLGVARFFLIQYTKTGKIYQNEDKIYKMVIKYICELALK